MLKPLTHCNERSYVWTQESSRLSCDSCLLCFVLSSIKTSVLSHSKPVFYSFSTSMSINLVTLCRIPPSLSDMVMASSQMRNICSVRRRKSFLNSVQLKAPEHSRSIQRPNLEFASFTASLSVTFSHVATLSSIVTLQIDRLYLQVTSNFMAEECGFKFQQDKLSCRDVSRWRATIRCRGSILKFFWGWARYYNHIDGYIQCWQAMAFL